ncbi:MAG: DUF5067 domain-containing protein [Clostridia bacterium]|nr:DUF5067 domain-containing protein [Clostridia bacterium]
MKKWIAILLAVLMCVLLCACGSDKKDDVAADADASVAATNAVTEDSTEAATEEETTAEPENKTIDLTTDNGSIQYLGFEKANEGLTEDANAIVVKFRFTNKQPMPAQCQSAFVIKFYQAGAQVDNAGSYSSKGGDQYELVGAFFNEALNGGSVEFGKIVSLKDDSPVTIMVSDRSDSSVYQMMEFDLNGTQEEADAAQETAAATEAVTVAPATEPEETFKTIRIGDCIETDKFNFTLETVEFTYELLPPNTSSVYSSYEAEDNKVYIHVGGSYYNKDKRDVCIRDLFIPHADYDNGYTYDGFAVVDDDNDFTWVSSYVVCTPLETCGYHGLISVPEMIESSDAPLFITLEIGGETYRYDIR